MGRSRRSTERTPDAPAPCEIAAAAHELWRFQHLREVLHLWRLRAVAYSDPGYEQAMEAAREGRDDDFIPAEQVIPGWSDELPSRSVHRGTASP
ncbi:DUF6247 family protein [Kribbella turkmenica]|uniref:DUF6247 family protein n=1 Tax=Kribbella turkmenica TaxID=2530375 RepID=UPI002278873B|nr:DUF6247 family protein [Kribbella turkmenica]